MVRGGLRYVFALFLLQSTAALVKHTLASKLHKLDARGRPVFKSSISKIGPSPWEIWTFKGQFEVKISNGSRIRDPQLDILEVEIKRTDRRWASNPRLGGLRVSQFQASGGTSTLQPFLRAKYKTKHCRCSKVHVLNVLPDPGVLNSCMHTFPENNKNAFAMVWHTIPCTWVWDLGSSHWDFCGSKSRELTYSKGFLSIVRDFFL